MRLALQARPCPSGTAEEPCVCRRFASDIFSFVLSRSSVRHARAKGAKRRLQLKSPGHPCRSFACSVLSTGAHWLQLSMDHWQKRPKDAVLRTAMSGGDESESGVTVAWHSSGAKSHRENEILFVIASATKWREAIQSQGPLWIASSLPLLAMTRMLTRTARSRAPSNDKNDTLRQNRVRCRIRCL